MKQKKSKKKIAPTQLVDGRADLSDAKMVCYHHLARIWQEEPRELTNLQGIPSLRKNHRLQRQLQNQLLPHNLPLKPLPRLRRLPIQNRQLAKRVVLPRVAGDWVATSTPETGT